MLRYLVLFILIGLGTKAQQPYYLVLGNAQDGGYPQAGCHKKCCYEAIQNPSLKHYVACIAIIDPFTKKSWLIDATPDFPEQLALLRKHMKDSTHMPSGVLLTHAHIGHYSGLMHLGREVMGAKNIPVYAMPRMKQFLENNGPWSQLVGLKNIQIITLKADSVIALNEHVSIAPVLVPHRDEYSETVGFSISTYSSLKIPAASKIESYQTNTLLYIPDIDKWEKWYTDSTAIHLQKLFYNYDHVLIDGTFNNESELGAGRMKDIPHPFIEESMDLMKQFPDSLKSRIGFIHLNHTNSKLQLWQLPLHMTNKLFVNGFLFLQEGAELK